MNVGEVDSLETLFVYGTLRCPACQKRVFGRSAPMTGATLAGWRRSKILLGKGRYPIIRRHAGYTVRGYTIEVTAPELAKLDHYEGEAYRRSRVRLTDGSEAWVYHARD